MSPQRWLFFAFSILFGIALGLLYGWVISPVQYVDTAPDSLRADYRTDYTLMVAEVYQTEQDLASAVRQLSLLGSDPPREIAAQALQFAQSNAYPPQDILLLQNLAIALQVYETSEALP